MPGVGLLDPDRMGDGRLIDPVAVDLAELALEIFGRPVVVGAA